jgi:hypothetical protein
MTLADMVVAIDPGIQLSFRIVEMKRRRALDPDNFVEFTERAIVSLLGANIIASRERVRVSKQTRSRSPARVASMIWPICSKR